MNRSIDDLLFECLERLGADPGEEDMRAVATEVGRGQPGAEPALFRRMVELGTMGLLGGEEEEEGLPTMLGDFELEQRLGGGGMGVVYRAFQGSVGRHVALKVLRPFQQHDPRARARFQREAEAVARLDHPNIVPVHTLGSEGSVPYLVMPYIRGVSLDRVLRWVGARAPGELSGRDLLLAIETVLAEEGRPPAEIDPGSEGSPVVFYRGSWHEVCMRIAAEVARALAHAHQRGVLHRDVKPSNIMVTPEGRVMLVDFGVASLAGADPMTRTGSFLGSLPYTAPEQLAGRRAGVDARCDVYGLGVTLYELLTLRCPFLDPESTERTRALILDGRPAPPRRLDPGLTTDAQTVCLTAMDRDRDRRYGSASALATDLENVLARRPIQARPAGALTHVRRWAQRRPGAALALVLALVMVSGGPTLYAVQAAGSKRRLAVQLDRADRHYRRSLDALDFVTRVAMEELSDVPRASAARRRMLKGVGEFYREVVEEPGVEDEVALDRARAQVQLAGLSTRIDEFEDASAALDEAFATYDRWPADATGAWAMDLSRAHRYRARILEWRGKPQAALAAFDLALELLPEGEAGERTGLRLERARSIRLAGDTSLAREELRGLLEDLEEVDLEADPRQARLAAACLGELNVIEAGARSLTDLERAAHILEAMATHGEEGREERHKRMLSLSNLGAGYLDLRRMEEALSTLEQAAVLAEDLATDFPGYPEYRFNLAGVLVNLGGAYVADDRYERAREYLERARRIARRLVEEDPRYLDARANLAAASSNLVALEVAEGRYGAALDLLDVFDRDLDELLSLRPGDVSARRGRRVNVINRVRSLLGLGRVAEACDEGAMIAESGDSWLLMETVGQLALVFRSEEAPAEDHAAVTDTILLLLDYALEAGVSAADILAHERLVPLHGEPRFLDLVAE